ncbi:hypothetical protein [Mameliella alba]|uniref:hypothetical protein n=1 Tax=Mameliella alba TaxID=561184 RepID=UPI000B532974|nr:hypothetical protein [Mameliella alba]MBY6121776.1 hypothetical protein [Mameliella alba]
MKMFRKGSTAKGKPLRSRRGSLHVGIKDVSAKFKLRNGTFVVPNSGKARRKVVRGRIARIRSEKPEHVPLTAEHLARIEEICAEPMRPTEHLLAAIKRAEKVS